MKKTETTTTKNTVVLCACGCEGLARKMFLQGHDARAKGNLIRYMAANGGSLAGYELPTGQGAELVKYAVGGGFGGRFLGAPTKAATVRKPRTTRAKAQAQAESAA